jgi:sulfatase modifying factor 1
VSTHSPKKLGGGIALGVLALATTVFAVLHHVMSDTPGQPAAPAASHEGMKWIPPGEFAMGTNDPNSEANERPARKVKVSGFWMDEHDVTNAEFRRFVQATGYITTAERPVNWEELKTQMPPGSPKPPDERLRPGSLVYTPTDHNVPLGDLSLWWSWTAGANWKRPQGPRSTIDGRDDYPVVQVSWDDAVAYAKWVGKCLPTEAQWEHAARGGFDGKRFVWGDEFMPAGRFMANTFTGNFPVTDTKEDGYAGTSPWKSFPPNGYGLYDMAGNVWQWTMDVYRESSADAPSCPACIPSGPAYASEIRRVTKGGSFLCSEVYCESYRPSARRGTPRDTGSEHVGFRCVASN